MEDRELLELAAKASGVNVQYSNNYGDFSIGEPYSKEEVRWNPLADNADAFVLAAYLGIFLRTDFYKILARSMDDGIPHEQAARLAIVTVAASIGRLKP